MMTGILGQAALGELVLGSLGGGASGDEGASNTLTLTQGVTVAKTLNVLASNTLSLSQQAVRVAPKTPIVGYSGGQGRHVYVKDITGNQVLYKLNEDTQLTRPASTIKLMTALVIMQWKSGNLSDTVTVQSGDLSNPLGMDMAGLAAGDIITFEGLLYGIFLPSGTDACQAAARVVGDLIYVAGGSVGTQGVTRFIEEMNAQATALGMSNTNFTGVSGESQTGSTVRNVISAKDAAILGAEAFTYTELRTIASTVSRTQPVTGSNPRDLNWSNYNRFINGPTNNQQGIKDDNVFGGKNGVWLSGGSWHNLVLMWEAPTGAEIVISVFYAESLYAQTLDVQGIIYSICKDFPYLETSSSVPPDPNFDTVKLLIGADGSIIDESNVGRTVTNVSVTVGDPVIASTGGAAFNSTGDYLSIADAADLEAGSGDQTVETWWQGNGDLAPGEEIWFAKADHTGSPRREWLVEYFSNNIQFFVNSSGAGWTNSTTAFALSSAERDTFFNGAPRHIALVKDGSIWALYVNGERASNTINVSSTPDTSVEVTVGYKYASVSARGEYDEFRLSQANARYTAHKHTLSPRKFSREASGDVEATNFLTLNQTVSCVKTINVSASNTLTLTQEANKVVDGEGESTLVLDHEATFEKYKTVTANNSLALTQSATVEVDYNRSVNQAVVLTQLATKQMYFYRAITSNLVLSQSATCIVSKLASNALVLDHEAEYTIAKKASNFLEVGQIVARAMTYNRALFSNFIPFQTLTREATFRRSVSNTLALTQSATFQLVKAVSNVLNLTQSATCYVAKPAFSTLVLSHAASENHTSNVSGENELFLVQSLIIKKAKAVQATSILGFNQFARGTKVLSASASNVLTLTQALVGDYVDESAENILVLSQSAVATRIINVSASNNLALTQALALSKTIVRSVSDTLVFKQSFEKRTGISSFPVVTVPSAQVTVTKRKCMMVLQHGAQTITLPCPEFQDSEGSVIRLNVKRSMNGTRRVYKRDNPTSQLKYDLVMDRLKAIELRNFILANNSNPLLLTNFKGELWFVLLTNTPFSFAEDSYRNSSYGNRSSISLEFEGVRLN